MGSANCFTTLVSEPFKYQLDFFLESDSTAQCPPLGPLLNGNITYSMELNPNYDPGTDATHVCNLGFVLIGSIIRVCQETTQWSEVPPTCQRKYLSNVFDFLTCLLY